MQMRTLLLIGFVVILACLSRHAPRPAQPLWSQQWKGWQKLFYLAGLIGALLIVLNPEFLALVFLGDAAFFDLLVFALSLQFQAAVIGAWHGVRDAAITAASFMVHRLERDWIAVAVTLTLLADWALKVWEKLTTMSIEV